MIGPAFLAFVCAKGEDVLFQGTHQQSAVDASPVDITGWTILVKATRKDGTVVLNDKPATVTDGPNGKYQWAVSHADSDVAAGLCQLDIWRTDQDSQRAMVIGTLLIVSDPRYGV